MIEIEVQPKRRRGADDAIAVEDDELAVGEQFEVLQVVRRLEALGVVERRKAEPLQRFERGRVLRPRVHDDEPVGKLAEEPHEMR